MRQTIRLTAMMIRPPIALLLVLFAAVGLALGGHPDGSHPLLTTVLLILGGWFVNATVLNDLADEAIDRVNLKDARGRPLVSGEATRTQLLMLGLLAGGTALVAAWIVNWRVGTVITVGLFLNIAYSFRPLRLSDRGLIAVILLPLGYVALPFLVGLYSVQPDLGPKSMAILAGLYISFMGRIVLKDFRDEEGDKLFGKRTFLIRYGREHTCIFSATCWIVGVLALIAIPPLQPTTIVVFAVYSGFVLHGLYLLARTDRFESAQVVIGGIAHVGRGMGITLLTHLTMVARDWSLADQALVHVAIASVFVVFYLEAVAQRETVDATALRPF